MCVRLYEGKPEPQLNLGRRFLLVVSMAMYFSTISVGITSTSRGICPSRLSSSSADAGYYPASVHADQIYRTRANRDYCRQRGIRLGGKPLGRPVVQEQAEVRQQAVEDARIRNQIEGKFGQGKRRFSLARVMAKLATTAQTTIAITFLVMNCSAAAPAASFCLFEIYPALVAVCCRKLAVESISFERLSSGRVMFSCARNEAHFVPIS